MTIGGQCWLSEVTVRGQWLLLDISDDCQMSVLTVRGQWWLSEVSDDYQRSVVTVRGQWSLSDVSGDCQRSVKCWLPELTLLTSERSQLEGVAGKPVAVYPSTPASFSPPIKLFWSAQPWSRGVWWGILWAMSIDPMLFTKTQDEVLELSFWSPDGVYAGWNGWCACRSQGGVTLPYMGLLSTMEAFTGLFIFTKRKTNQWISIYCMRELSTIIAGGQIEIVEWVPRTIFENVREGSQHLGDILLAQMHLYIMAWLSNAMGWKVFTYSRGGLQYFLHFWGGGHKIVFLPPWNISTCPISAVIVDNS